MSYTSIAAIAVIAILAIWALLQSLASAERRKAVARQIAIIREGSLPIITPPANVPLAKGEVMHAYISAKGVQSDNDRELGEGKLVVSSKRVRFIGKRRVSLAWGKIDSVGASGSTVMVYAHDGRGYEFAMKDTAQADLVGEILDAVTFDREA